MGIRVDRKNAVGLPSASLVACIVGLTACSPSPGPSAEEVAKASQAIINGVPSDTADDTAIAIPLFQNGQFAGACSGVLIAPNLVLTARHCVSQTDEGSACDVDGTPILGGNIYSDRAAADIGVITGAKLKFDLDGKGKQIFVPASTTLCNQDIALVLLEAPITSVPFAQVRLDKPPVVDEQLRSVGWGLSNNSSGYGRRRRDNVSILQVGPVLDSSGLGGVGAHEFEVGEAICSGDSGGPAYDETTHAVIGVVSRGGNGAPANAQNPSANCVDAGKFKTFNLYTRVDGFPDLMAQAFAAAGTDPWHEGGPDPRKAKTGEACSNNDACRSALCVDPSDKGYCSQPCDDTPGSCTAPMKCEAQDGQKICRLPKSGCDFSGTSRRDAGGWPPLLALSLCALLLGRRRISRRGS